MGNSKIDERIEFIRQNIGVKSPLITKKFFIGNEYKLDAVIIYVNGISDKTIIDRDILYPLMINVNEDLRDKDNISDYICKKYISMSNTMPDTNYDNAVTMLKRGKSVIVIDGVEEFIIIDTTTGMYRSISEPENETSVKGSREGFNENLETSISKVRKKVKDKNLAVEIHTVGRRSQSDMAILYIDDLVDKDILNEIKSRIDAVDIDGPFSPGQLEQYIETYTYTVFPQVFSTERIDISISNLMEGKIVMLVEGYAVALITPALFMQFFQAVEDYDQRTIVSSFVRLLRIFSAFIVISLPAIYLTLLKFNAELIPIKFITPIIQSRIGIALTPFLEIFAMEIVVEFLREGGLRLPTKIAQTLSLVGGIIIGDTAIKSKIVSPTTLLVVGVTVISTFLIPNYDMSLAIRMLRFPMLILADAMGIFGISLGWFFILVHLCSLDSFGVPYFELKGADFKDTFIRAPLWKMNKRPEGIPNENPVRQTDFRKKFRRN